MSQLGLGMTAETDTRGRKTRPRGSGGGSGRAVFVAALVVVALAGAAVYGVVHWFSGSPDYPGPGHGSVVVQIQQGDSLSQIGTILERADVVHSASAFLDAASANSSATAIQPGSYRMRLQMSGAGAVTLLLDPAARIVDRAVIPEGLRLNETVKILVKATKLPASQFDAVLAHPAGLGLPVYAGTNPEGFLYPATYDLVPGMTARQILTEMVHSYNQAMAGNNLVQRAAAVHLTPYQVIIMASIVQAEGRPVDYGKMARTIQNRLAAGMKLQLDSTVDYALGTHAVNLTSSQLAVASPYNTFLIPGLPPGPINSPGLDAINAVLTAPQGNWLYWVTVNLTTGETKFTNSYSQFLQYSAQLNSGGG
jgi:UPF0755 protein